MESIEIEERALMSNSISGSRTEQHCIKSSTGSNTISAKDRMVLSKPDQMHESVHNLDDLETMIDEPSSSI